MVLRAGGRTAGSDRGRRPTRLTIGRTEVLRVHRENLLINYRKKVDKRTQGYVVRALIYSDRHSYRPLALWTCKTYLARAPLDGRRSRVGALGEATSSQNQVMTYPCYVMILKPSPVPTHHLPWAGFGLRQPHWLIQKCDVEK